MNRSIIIPLIVAIFVVHVSCKETYSDKYDYIDAKATLANERLREQYYNCFIDKAPCLTPDAKFFKGNFPEVIVTQCRKCTKKQVEMFDTIVTWYTANRPEEWNVAVAKFIETAKKKNIH